MVNWIDKVRGKATGVVETAPEPFALNCECGLVHEGHRRRRHQQIICRDCGAALFVLPQNVYPPLKPVRKKRPPRRAGKGEARGAMSRDERVWGSAAAEIGASVKQRVKVAGAGTRTALARRMERMRQGLTPFRLLMAAMLLIFAGTVAWKLHARSLRAAETALAHAAQAGFAAMQAGDYIEARDQYLIAVDALDRLEQDDPQARQIRQRSRELTALSRLSSASLMDVVLAAEQAGGLAGRREWAERFRIRYGSDWIVVDGRVELTRKPGGPRRFSLVFPVEIGGLPVTLEADFDQWHALPEDAKSALTQQRVVFSGQWHSCRYDADGWTFVLNPQTGFLWTDASLLEPLGFEFDEWYRREDIVKTLERQATWLSVPLTDEDSPDGGEVDE